MFVDDVYRPVTVAAVSPYTVTGGDTALTDDSDATFATVPAAAPTAATDGVTVTFPPATIPPLATIPADAFGGGLPGAGYFFRYRAEQTVANSADPAVGNALSFRAFQGGVFQLTYSNGTAGITPADGLVTRESRTTGPSEPAYDAPVDWFTFNFYGWLTAGFEANFVALSDGDLIVSELELHVVYNLPGGGGNLAAPPLRLLQRGDGLGLSGTPRLVGVKTVQRSLRRGPGSIL